LQGGDEVGRMTSVSCDVNPESCDETLDSRTPETPPPPTPPPPPPTLPPPTLPPPQAAACATWTQTNQLASMFPANCGRESHEDPTPSRGSCQSIPIPRQSRQDFSLANRR